MPDMLCRRVCRSVVVILAAIALHACASPAEMQNMVVSQQSLASVVPNSDFENNLVIASVTGGETTNPLWTSEVDGAAFQGALRASLEQNRLLAKSSPESRFNLYAALKSVNQPLFGLDLTVSSAVTYRIVERKTDAEWFNDAVVASYTATFSDAAFAIQRLRLANEGSIRENIKAFIARLAATKPPTASAPASTTVNKSSTEELLRELKKLFDGGLIKKDEYDLKKEQILKGL